MIRYKINIYDALQRAGFNTGVAKSTGILSQSTMTKIKEENPALTLDNINRICGILDLQPKDLIEYVQTDSDRELIGKFTKKSD